MKIFHFKSQRTVAQPIIEVFEFFSNAHNLAVITPPVDALGNSNASTD